MPHSIWDLSANQRLKLCQPAVGGQNFWVFLFLFFGRGES